MKKKLPILILHGWNLNSDKFQPLILEFEKKGFQVLCPDLPGFGKSTIPSKPYHLSDYILFVINLLDKKKISKVNFVGHSFGGRIGIKFAAMYPGYIKNLILTGAPGINPVPKGKIMFFLSIAKIGRIIFSIPILSNFAGLLRRLLYKIAGATDFYHTNEKMRQTFKNVIRENLVPYLQKIKSKTLLLWGENDGIVPLQIARRMHKLIPDSKLVIIPGSRHGVPWTHPKEFYQAVNKFI